MEIICPILYRLFDATHVDEGEGADINMGRAGNQSLET